MVKRILEELDGFHLEGDGFVQDASDELRTWLESAEGKSSLQQMKLANLRSQQELNRIDVPFELRKRVTRFVQQQLDSGQLAEADDATMVSQKDTDKKSPRSEKSSSFATRSVKRWPVAIAASLAGFMVAGAVMAVALWPQPKSMSPEGIAQSILRQAPELTDQTWFEVTPEVLASAPLPEDLLVQPVRCSILQTEWNRETVVYDLSGPEIPVAMLFVARLPANSGLSNRFPDNPDYFTGTLSIASSHQRDYLYVLLVEGNAANYRSVLMRVWPFG